MGVLEINNGTKFEFSIKDILNKDSYPNIKIYTSISNDYINYSYENDYYEEEIEGLLMYLNDILYSKSPKNNSYELQSSNIKFRASFKLSEFELIDNLTEYNDNLKLYIYLNIPLDSRLYYEKYVIKLNSIDVLELYTSLVNEDTLKRSLNDNTMYKEQINEKIYLCAVASYTNHGKNYTFLVDEKAYHKKWKIAGTNTEVYFKRFKQIEESNLPCDISKMKKLIPILEDNIIEYDTYNFDFVSIDCKDTLLIYNLILQNEEKLKMIDIL